MQIPKGRVPILTVVVQEITKILDESSESLSRIKNLRKERLQSVKSLTDLADLEQQVVDNERRLTSYCELAVKIAEKSIAYEDSSKREEQPIAEVLDMLLTDHYARFAHLLTRPVVSLVKNDVYKQTDGKVSDEGMRQLIYALGFPY